MPSTITPVSSLETISHGSTTPALDAPVAFALLLEQAVPKLLAAARALNVDNTAVPKVAA